MATSPPPPIEDLATISRTLNHEGARLSDQDNRTSLDTIRNQFTHGSGPVPLCRIPLGQRVDALTPQTSQAF